MKLTPNFTLQEMTISQTAERHGIDNTPNSEQIINLKRVSTVLEVIRATIDRPVMVSSGFRCLALNTAVRGSSTSKHMEGLAVDFHVAGMTPHDVIEAVKHVVPYRTLIDEFGRWVHLDIERGKILKAHKKINGATHYDRIN